MKKTLLIVLALAIASLSACNTKSTSTEKKYKTKEEITKKTVVETVEDDSYVEEDSEYDVPEIIPVGNTSNIMLNLSGGYDKEASVLRERILNAKDNLKIKGTTYYVSPKGNDDNDGLTKETAWKSFEGITMNNYSFESGDAILFERGGVYRQTSTMYVKSGLTLGAYGKGEKPKIYGSQMNYAQPELWEPSNKKNVWKLQLSTLDAGLIVFNHGEAVGTKKDGLLELEKNGDFYHNVDESIFYLYLDKGYPDMVYKDIEIGTKGNMFFVTANAQNVVFDNLCIKYTGSHGIGTTGQTSNMRVTNCEIGWIGGSYQDEIVNPGVRYGNGIQFWDTTTDSIVENNWVYQCYDTGITFQGEGPNSLYNNLVFKNNLVEYCIYSFEFWDSQNEGNTIKNILVENNISRFSGYCWSANQRSENSLTSHIFFGSSLVEGISDFVIQNNIFDRHAYNLIYYGSRNGKEFCDGFTIRNNSYYQKANNLNRVLAFGNTINTAKSQIELKEALQGFDKTPNEVIFEQ